MSTQRQKKLAKAIVENITNKQTKTAGELLETAGYGIGTAEGSPGRTIEQKGVQEELEILGFSEFNAKSVVSSIMNDESQKAEARLKAADMTFKVHGSYAPEKIQTNNLNVNLSIIPDVLEEADRIIKLRMANRKSNEETKD